MSFDLIIKNGTVILENEARVVDIAVKDGKIAAIGQDLGDAKDVMDASGLVVSPGMVDAHTHISEPGRSHWEGYETGTRAAAKGGITTMIEMPLNQLPATVDRASIELKFDAAKGKLTIDAAQLGGLVSYNIDRLHELDEVGVVGFKCFVATCGDRGIDNDFRDVNDWQFFKGAQKLGRNIASAVPALARLARSYRLAIVHGNGPQVGLLALQNLAWKEVEPYPLDVLVAESQGMIGYMLAQSLSAQPQMPPVTTVLTRIEVSPDDPAFLQPEKFIGPVYQPEEQEALEAAYGWQMKRDGKYLRRVVASPQPRKILDSEAIELLLKEGHVVICSGGGGVPVTEDGAGSEAVIDKDLAAALLAEQINADGLVILTDADAVYENWGTPQQRAIRHATPDELAPFAKADGSMGPKVTAVSGYVRSRGKPAWIGALSRIEETLAGEAGTCISL